MKMKIDLSKFKISSNDGKKAILHHPDGHVVHIAVNALHPLNRKNLDALEKHEMPEEAKKSPPKMADGGEVIKKENYSGGPKLKSFIPVDGEVFPPADQSQHMNSKALPKKFADGGDIDFTKNSSSMPVEEPLPEYTPTPADESSVPVPLPPGYAKSEPSAPSDYSGVKNLFDGISAVGAGFRGEPLPEKDPVAPEPALKPGQMQPMSQAPSPQMPPDAPQASAAAPSTPSDPAGLGKQQSMIQEGFNAGQQGIQQEQVAQQQMAKAKAAQAQDQVQKLQAIDQDFKTRSADTMQQIDHVITDYKNGHINPNHYMESMDSGRKVMTAIGMILGGLGGSDAPVKFLNDQINRDVDAQKANLDKNNNILAAYNHQFGNIKDATDMAKMTQVGIYGAQLDKAAADAATPEAKARALQAKSQLYQQYAPVLQRFTMNQMLTDSARKGGDPSQLLPYLRITNPEMAKEMETRMVPGSGPQGQAEMAKVPLSEGARQDILAKTDLVKATQNMKDWMKAHGSVLDKMDPATRSEGETLINELQGKYRKGVGASSSEGEQKLIAQVTGMNPAGFLSAINTSPKLKALEESIGSSLNTTRKQYGLPTHDTGSIREQDLSPQHQKLLEAARKNPTHPNAQLILNKLGIK